MTLINNFYKRILYSFVVLFNTNVFFYFFFLPKLNFYFLFYISFVYFKLFSLTFWKSQIKNKQYTTSSMWIKPSLNTNIHEQSIWFFWLYSIGIDTTILYFNEDNNIFCLIILIFIILKNYFNRILFKSIFISLIKIHS